MSRQGKSNPRLLREVTDLERWLKDSRPGDWAAYHDGFLLWDREPSPLRHNAARQLRALADAVHAAHIRGDVFLLQSRIGPATFRYYAVRKAPVKVFKRPEVQRGMMGSGRFVSRASWDTRAYEVA